MLIELIMKLPTQNETDIKTAICSMLKRQNIFHYRAAASMFSKHGISDIIGSLPTGRIFAIEVKRSDWKPPGPRNTKAFKHYMNQKAFQTAVRGSNGIAFFAQSIDEVIGGLGLKDRFLM